MGLAEVVEVGVFLVRGWFGVVTVVSVLECRLRERAERGDVAIAVVAVVADVEVVGPEDGIVGIEVEVMDAEAAGG